MFIVLTALLALSQESVEVRSASDGPLEIDVFAEEHELRYQLHRRLQDLGYGRLRTRRDRDVYHHSGLWKPSLHLFHDGRFEIHRAPVRIGPPGQGPWGTGGNRICLKLPATPPAGMSTRDDLEQLTQPKAIEPVCLHLDGALAGRRHVASATRALMHDVGPLLVGLRQARGARLFREHLSTGLPGRLRRMWEEAASPAEGRAALLEHWCTRTDTPEGAAVRGEVERYLARVVNQGPDPVTADELEQISQRCRGYLEPRDLQDL